MNYRRYNLTLASVLAPVVLLLATTSAFLQPYDGGLTRLGGYPEKLYGWTGTQLRFDPPLYRQHMTRQARYREPADVVVLGDSFTYLTDVSWPNYFVQQTGLRLQSFRIDKTPIDQLLASEGFRARPPRVLIYQTVERELWNRLRGETTECRARGLRPGAPLPVLPLPFEPEPYRREAAAAWLDFSLSIDFLAKLVPREIFGRDRTAVARLALDRAAPFSSVERRQLLVYRDDLGKRHWTPPMWEQIRCNLAGLQNRVQAGGQTFFIAMIAPDKLTAYAEWLADPRYRGLSRFDLLAADPDLHLPRLDVALQRAIRAEIVDVYLNNDTHWGSAGYEIVARELADYLTRAGVIGPVRQPQRSARPDRGQI
jgi:hypothetical protein